MSDGKLNKVHFGGDRLLTQSNVSVHTESGFVFSMMGDNETQVQAGNAMVTMGKRWDGMVTITIYEGDRVIDLHTLDTEEPS